MNSLTSSPASLSVTELLLAWNNGESAALDELLPLVYAELRRLARRQMRNERAEHTLQTSDLVNEAYLRLIDSSRVRWQNRAHFFAVAAQMMRRVLVDHARSRNAEMHGGGSIHIELSEGIIIANERLTEVLMIDESLDRLAVLHPQVCRVVEMKFFAGLEGQEIAEVLGVTPGRVSQLWKFAQSWLRRDLGVGERNGMGKAL